MPLFKDDFYKLLGVSRDTSDEAINRAFRKISRVSHPDKVAQAGGGEAEVRLATEAFKLVQLARDTLLNPEKRKAYDQQVFNQDKPNQLVVPHGLTRPSVVWSQYRDALKTKYSEHPLERVDEQDRQQFLKSVNPLSSEHFSPFYYQNLYLLTKTDQNGKDIDEPFSDVYSYIEEKSARFVEENDACDFLKEPVTPKIAKILALNFLKGKYFGPTLIHIKDYLQAGLTDKPSFVAVTLYGAILKLMSIKNLKVGYQEALQAIHALYDAAFQRYQSIEGQVAIVSQIYATADKEYQQASSDEMSAKTILDFECKQLNEAEAKLAHLKEMLETLNVAIQSKKGQKDLSADALEGEIDRLDNLRYACLQSIDGIDDQLVSFRISKQQAYDTHQTLVQCLAPLRTRLSELLAHQQTLETRKMDSDFLDLIDSKYFKMTLAMSVSHYLNDKSPAVSPEALARITSGLAASTPDMDHKYTALGQVLRHADRRMAAIALTDVSVEQYCDHADYFFDLSASGIAKIDAYIAAGLCWQMAARRSTSDIDQMVFERQSLTVYQLAIQLAAKMPASYALYAMVHISKYLSELQFKPSTMSLQDYQKLVANLQNRYEKIPASQYSLLSVHNGSSLDSMEGAMDRAFYLMTCFPSYSAHTHLLDQLQRQRCYAKLMEGLVERFALKLEDPERLVLSDAEMAEQFYYRYEKELTLERPLLTKLNDLRLQTMNLLLEQSKTSLKELNQLMNAPYISIPQNEDGWWVAGPLNYPDDPDGLGLVLYKSFDGYWQDQKTGEIQLLLTRWMPGDKPEDRLFTHDDLHALIRGGIGRAIFSLDPNSSYRKYDPLQVVRFSPSALDGTEYLRSMFEADYLMKEFSQGVEINGQPPYTTRPIRLLDGLDESVKRELLVCTEASGDDESQSRATRFWIQMGAIGRSETEKGYRLFVSYSEPEVVIKKQLLTIGVDGQLEDAPIDTDDHSRQAKFAEAFTKHYNSIREQLPVFRQMEEFYKISGAIEELQKKRMVNKLTMDLLKTHLNDPAFWQSEAEKKRKEWTDNLNSQPYWDERLSEKVASLTRLLKDDAHWERLIDDHVKTLEKTRESLQREQGEEYQRQRSEWVEKYQKIFTAIHQAEPALAWTLKHPDFKKHYEAIWQDFSSNMIAQSPDAAPEVIKGVFDLLFNAKREFSTTEEAIFHAKKTGLKKQLTAAFQLFRSAMGVIPYKAARDKFMQGDVASVAHAQAQYEVMKHLAGDEASPEMISFWDALQKELLAAATEELGKKRQEEGPQIGLNLSGQSIEIKVTKPVYSIDDPEFLAFYTALRQHIRQKEIDGNRPNITNWAQFESQYLAQIDALLERDFTKQKQLTDFNAAIANSRAEKKTAWTMEILLESRGILAQFNGDQVAFEAAVEELLNGNIQPLARAYAEMRLEEIKKTIKNHGRQENPFVQKALEDLLSKEEALQTVKMQQAWATLSALPKEKQGWPEYHYLKPYFSESAFEHALDEFMQGNSMPFIEGRVVLDFEDALQELSGELYPKAKEAIDEAKVNLQTNLEATAKQCVDRLKASLVNNMEAQIAEYISDSKDSLKDSIESGNRMESGFIHLQLGKAEPESAASNTKLRVPAIFSRHEGHSVYGGVNALPTFKVVSNLYQCRYALGMAGDYSRGSQIERAKRELCGVSWQASRTNLHVQWEMDDLQKAISAAERDEARHRTFLQKPVDFFQQSLRQDTFSLLRSSDTPISALHSWRYVGQMGGFGGGGSGGGDGGGNGFDPKREHVLANIRASQLARESSNFGSFAQRSTALDFYTSNGFQPDRAFAHMRGIDFDQPVEVITLPKGTEVVQYMLPGSAVGKYFAQPGETGCRLGVYTSGRVQATFFATRDVRALKTTAAAIVDDYSMQHCDWIIETNGGGTQYFSPDSSAWRMKP